MPKDHRNAMCASGVIGINENEKLALCILRAPGGEYKYKTF